MTKEKSMTTSNNFFLRTTSRLNICKSYFVITICFNNERANKILIMFYSRLSESKDFLS